VCQNPRAFRYSPPVRAAPVFVLVMILVATVPACGGSAPPARSADDGKPNVIAVTEAMGSPRAGDLAPDFELVDQDGAKTRLSSLRGSPVVLAFVTSWCPFSRAEQPYLKKFADEYTPKGVKFVAVDLKEPEADYREYLSRVAMPFPVLRDESGQVALSYVPPRALPDFTERYKVVVTSNLVLDRQGVIRFFALADLRNFDAAYVHARRAVDALLAEGTKS
jgi:peroxiredoxin